jgi:Domain of unknown function (DUF6484)
MQGIELVQEPGDLRVASDELQPQLAARPVAPHSESLPGVVIGELVAIAREGRVPLVRFSGQRGLAALRARSVIDLHSGHVGQQVALMFENGNADEPIIMGLLRGGEGWPLEDAPAQLDVDADGRRLHIGAREQLVLRCGQASITLTKAGKVLIEGSYVLSRSSGANRIKGGSVDIN